ncbi:MAG: putative Ig domain-containing protein [Planctomycetota bacterium]
MRTLGTLAARISASITFGLVSLLGGCSGSSSGGAAVVTAPSIDAMASAVPAAIGGNSYFARIRSDGTPPFTYSVTSGTLPAGISLLPNSGDLTGTPTSIGTFEFEVTATNSAGSDTLPFSIAVSPDPDLAPTITTTSVPDATVALAYEQQITVTGEAPITFSITGGSLPAGLVLDTNTGRIAGTPALVDPQTFTLLATNSHGSDSQELTIGVLPIPTAPTITSPVSGVLPQVRVGNLFEQSFLATGSAPMTWSLSAGAPQTVNINPNTGQLGGISLAEGTFNFDVLVTNVAGSDSLSVTLEFVQVPVIAFTLVDEGVVGSTVSLFGSGFDPIPANNSVEFGGTAARVLAVTSPFTLNVEVPPGTPMSPVSIVVTVDGQDSNAVAFTVDPTTVFFVDADATGTEDGSSWTDAFTDLQSALAAASDTDQIRIAEGRYSPGNARDDTFQPIDEVQLLGGYAGVSGLGNTRDPLSNPTVLDGDVLGDDAGASGRSENNEHVVTATSTGSLFLDGLTIRGGQANGIGTTTGAGVLAVTSGNVALLNCRFEENAALGDGAAVFVNSTSMALSTIADCIFESNESMASGGAVSATTNGLKLTRSVFSDNDAAGSGAIAVAGADLDASDLLFVGNTSSAGNAAVSVTAMDSVLSHLTVTANTGTGAAVKTSATGIEIYNSVIHGNLGAPSNAQLSNDSATLRVTHTLLGGGLGNVDGVAPGSSSSILDVAPQFFNAADPKGPDDMFATNDDGLRPAAGSPLLNVGEESESSSLDLTSRTRELQPNTSDLGAYEGAGV